VQEALPMAIPIAWMLIHQVARPVRKTEFLGAPVMVIRNPMVQTKMILHQTGTGVTEQAPTVICSG